MIFPSIRHRREEERRKRIKRSADSQQRRVKHREELEGIKRVLTLVDGYLSTQPQDLALAWDGGIMTYGELRHHLNAALKNKVLNVAPSHAETTRKEQHG